MSRFARAAVLVAVLFIVFVSLIALVFLKNNQQLPDQVNNNQIPHLQSLLWAAYAERQFAAGDINTALSLAVEANRFGGYAPEAQHALEVTAYPPGVARVLSPYNPKTGIRSGAISPNGQAILVGEIGGRLTLRDFMSGNVIREFKGHERTTRAIGFSPDGTRIVSGDEDGKVIVWDVTTAEKLHEWIAGRGSVDSVMFSFDGKLILTTDLTRVDLWDVITGKEILHFDAPPEINGIFKAVFSLDGHSIAMSGSKGYLVLWNTINNSTRQFFGHQPDSIVSALAFSPDGQKLLSGSTDSQMFLWDVISGQAIGQFQYPIRTQISSVAFSPNGRQIVSDANNSQLIVWDTETFQEIHRFKGFAWDTVGAVFTHDGQQIVSWDNLDELVVWDIQDEQIIQQFKSDNTNFHSIAMSPDGKIAAISKTGEIWLWDMSSNQVLKQLIGHQEGRSVNGIDFSPNGLQLISAGDAGELILWDVSTGQEIRRFAGVNTGVSDTAFSPDGKQVISATLNRQLILWDVSSGSQIRSFVGHSGAIYSADFSPDGSILVSSGDNGEVILWDVSSGQEIRRILGHDPTQPLYEAKFSPDGKLLASGDFSNDLILSNPENGSPIRKLKGNIFEFSPDSKYILAIKTLTADGILWDVNTGEEIRHFDRYPRVMGKVAFSPDGKSFMSASGYGDLILWRIQMPDELLHWVYTHRYIPELTCEQRETYSVTPLCDANGLSPTRTAYP